MKKTFKRDKFKYTTVIRMLLQTAEGDKLYFMTFSTLDG